MPIYAYKCESCGYAKDVLQKLSDAPLTECPECGLASFKKQVTAASFQLKGSGWYVTDFRGGESGAQAPKSADGEGAGPASPDKKTADTGAAASTANAPASAAATPAPAATAAAPVSIGPHSNAAAKAA
ncbi:MAG: FmdB family transcriptional regulator [Burkholderiales bacterium RIFCSPHIGHO2_12_FULL_61_11]|nr:MAG: FmdB family transcriptional regulator [Burkholderiales bacterium RIFCSPHIGHO2_12_FULL_61_11]